MDSNRYAPPSAAVQDFEVVERRYVGFWARVGAGLIDGVVFAAVSLPILIWAYGLDYLTKDKDGLVAGPIDFFVSYVLQFVAIVLFWHFKRATPGKMLIGAQVVDAVTGNRLSIGQSVTRYFALIIAGLPLGLGLFWIAFDRRKQGWHDKIANSVVIADRKVIANI